MSKKRKQREHRKHRTHADVTPAEKRHVDEARVEDVHVEQVHVEEAHVGEARVDEIRVEEAYISRQTAIPAHRAFRFYHATLIVPLLVLIAANYWLGREMSERYQFNRLRHVRSSLSWDEYIFHLEKIPGVFAYDGRLHLELARQLFVRASEQADRADRLTMQGQGRRAVPLYKQAHDRFKLALEPNQRAFETNFDVEAYAQMAWTHMEFYGVATALRREEEARRALDSSIAGFNRVLVLNPGDIDSLEHLTWIHSHIAGNTKRLEDWERSIDYAKRLLDEQHDNLNAFFFLGVACDNTKRKGRAAIYYMQALTYPSTMPREKELFDRTVVRNHLRKLGVTKTAVPPKK